MIVSLTAENFMRLRAVTIKPDGSLVQITGKNGAGKSSVLNAIAWTLGGAKHEPVEPIRRGADSTRVALVINDKYLVEKVNENGKSKLKVTSPDGKKKYASPQTLLNELYADIGFDPLAFVRDKPAAQAETLRKLAGLDFTEIDTQTRAAYDSRTDINRDARRLEAQLDAFPEQEGVPEKEVDVAELAQDLADAQAEHHLYAQYNQTLTTIEVEIERLKDALLTMAHKRGETAAKIANPPTSDPQRIQESIGEAQATNDRIRLHLSRHAKVAELQGCRKESEAYTEKIETLRADRRLMIEAADMPLEGLGFDDDGLITYNRIPFSQASQSEQLRISTAIGMKLNPGGVILIRDGSLLDTEHLAMLEEMTEKAGACVWIERVSDGEQIGFTIEDGNLVDKNVEVPA